MAVLAPGSAKFLSEEQKEGSGDADALTPAKACPCGTASLGGTTRVPRAPVPAWPRGEDGAPQHPQDGGRSTDNKKELLYKTQIDPSQLMGEERKGRREKQQLGFRRTMWGERRKREEDECGRVARGCQPLSGGGQRESH